MEINFLAVGVATILGIVIGSVWFGPKTFFPIWWKFLGRKPSEQPGSSNMALIFGLTFVGAFVQALVLSIVIGLALKVLGTISWFDGMAIGALMGVGFAAASSISHQLFGGFSLKAWVLEVGQDILSLSAMGVVLALML